MVTAASIASSIHRMPRLAAPKPAGDEPPAAIETCPARHEITRVTGKDGAAIQQQYGVLVVPAEVSVAEWVEKARKLREDRK
ncbi:MAG: hypothetical protein QGI13_03680 [Rhodospirillales bacterium]|jgi:hypothetical protein|nr:hypothetical protein [Rhodospirillales bacterium]